MRKWIDGTSWQMVCDTSGCPTVEGPFTQAAALPVFYERGWAVANVFGDRCPSCVAELGPLRPGKGSGAAHPDFVLDDLSVPLQRSLDLAATAP